MKKVKKLFLIPIGIVLLFLLFFWLRSRQTRPYGQELLENGYVTGRPYLGISYFAVTDAQTAAQLGVNAYGVYIVEVVKGGPADKAGLQAADRIVSVDGSEVATQSDLGTLMQNHKAGDTIEITVARGGQMQTVTVTLGEKGADNN